MAITLEQYRNLKFGTQIYWSGWQHRDGDPNRISICSGYLPEEGAVSLILHKKETIVGWCWPSHILLYLQKQGHVVDPIEYRGWWIVKENITLVHTVTNLNCVECKESYDYAEPNFDGDKLVCYPCRDRLGWKYTPKVNGFIFLR